MTDRFFCGLAMLERLLPRTITFGLQVMSSSPLADADPPLQSIFVCRSKVNATVETADRSFLRCSEAAWKAAIHAGKKI